MSLPVYTVGGLDLDSWDNNWATDGISIESGHIPYIKECESLESYFKEEQM